MSGLSKIKKEVFVHGYESVWLSRWTRKGNGFELQARSNRDAKMNLQEDGQLWKKEPTGSMEPKRKMLLDLFPIPDMNKEPPLVADRENSIDEEEEGRTSSNTKSSKESKRLKTNASDYSGSGTKDMMVVEQGPSQEKVNYYFHRFLRCGINKPGSRRNQFKNLKRGGGGGGDGDFTLLNPWIQRWCKKKDAESHEQGGGGGQETVNTKGTTLEKQFPSIAAMALMGKALSLNPTGMKKTNSLFVWNAKELR